MPSDQKFFIKPHYAFALTYFLAIFNVMGTISLPWLVVFLPVLLSAAPVILFTVGILAIVGYLIATVIGTSLSDYFGGEN